MKCLKLAFIYKNNDTLRYVKFLYKKNTDNSKIARQFALRFLYKKILTLYVMLFFVEFLKLAEGGAFLYAKNNSLFVTFLYAK